MYLANRKQIVANEFVVSNMCLQTLYVCGWKVSYYYVTNVFSDVKFAKCLALNTAIDSFYMYIFQWFQVVCTSFKPFPINIYIL